MAARISPARQAAFKILQAVERGEAHSDDLLRGKAVSALAPADRNLATALVLGVLRWQLQLDEHIRPLLKRPNAKLDAEVRIALRLGAFQLLHLDRIPAHAAIDESVELTKQAGHRFAAGMVNAVLRGISRGGAAEGQETQAHPAWLVERWQQSYGAEAACAICAHGQQQPRLSLRLTDAATEAELAQAGVQLAPGELLSEARTVLAGEVTATAAFREGRVRLQDEGSQLVGEIAAALLPKDATSGHILDACAAPGGKTLILAERHPQAHILACEASPQRLAALRERLSWLAEKVEFSTESSIALPQGLKPRTEKKGLNVWAEAHTLQGSPAESFFPQAVNAAPCRVEFRLADAAALEDQATFDVALADVPCSGTGTLGRNPEIRHRLHAEDLARQAERQRAILAAALRAVRCGGRVVYSTCSLEPEENEQVVAAVLAEHASAREIPVAEILESMRRGGIIQEAAAERLRACGTAEGALRLLPEAFGTDGFFVAALEKLS